MATKAKTAAGKEIELNRWCIEQALRWPVVHVPATFGQAGLNQYQNALGSIAQPARDVDADVIGRATKIAAWIKASH